MRVLGKVRARNYDKNRELIYDSGFSKNQIVATGFAGMAGLLIDVGGVNAFSAIGIGIGTTATTVSDTILESEITTGGGERRSGVNVTKTRITTTQTNDTADLDTTFAFTASFAVSETAFFNAASGGTMGARKIIPIQNVVNGQTLQITWRVQFKD